MCTFQTHPDSDINQRDAQGRTSLTISVQHEHGSLMDYLLSCNNITLGDSLLFAVKMGNQETVEKLLDFQEK